MNFFYLHGWASSPCSSKAQYFKQRFEEQHLTLSIPDLNQPDFSTLTMQRQLAQVKALLPTTPVTLIGSSLGGLTALWLAQHCPQVERLVLFAPALEFLKNLHHLMGAQGVEKWKQQNTLDIFHFAYEKTMPIHYDFVQTMTNYPDHQLQRALPTLILHGQHDQVIPVHSSIHFAATRPWIKLQILDSDHSLGNVQNTLWSACAQFCHLEHN